MSEDTRYLTRPQRLDAAQLGRGMAALPSALHRMGYKALRPGQDKVVATLMAGKDAVVILPTACHAKGQGILMADGAIRAIETLRVGEFVMGWDNTPRRITALKRGSAPSSRILPHKRDSFVVTDEHLLTLVRTREKKNPKFASQDRAGEVVDVSVRDYNKWSKWQKHIYKLFTTSTPKFYGRCDTPSPVDPYFMGVMLGDATFRKSCVEVSKPDPEIKALCEEQARLWGLGFTEYAPQDGRCVAFSLHNNGKHNNPLTSELRALGLWGLSSLQKFIPDVFKYADGPAREALLAGLLDTDGSRCTGGYDFISASQRLADDLVFIARSLGLSANSIPCKKSCGDFTGDYWRVFVSGEALLRLPMRIARKKPDATTWAGKKDVTRCGFKVESVGVNEFFGITIEGDGRYLMADFTVTHNTGKTACFAVPTIALGWRTLVFVPLISLMRDMVRGLAERNVRAGCLNSQDPAMNEEYLRMWLRGELDILIVAPERLLNDAFKQAMRQRRPDFVVVDEAHCLSAWSHNFRSAYCVVGDFITEYSPKLVASFTATCPPEVESDIRRVMCLSLAYKVVYYPRRENLHIKSLPFEGDAGLVPLLESNPGSSIIYCATTKRVEELAGRLSNLMSEEVGFYHGQLGASLRSHNQDAFMSGRTRIVCATNAFGMGVDKPDVRAVYHYDLSDCVESWAQELGRAGRDGKPSVCMSFLGGEGVRLRKFLLQMSNPEPKEIARIFKVMDSHKNAKGIVTLVKDDIAKKAGLQAISRYEAIMQYLIGSQVVERLKITEKIAAVRFLNIVDDPKFQNLRKAVYQDGTPSHDPTLLEFDIVQLARRMDISETTLRKRFRDLEQAGLLQFLPPERAAPVQIIGDASMIDLEQAQVRLDRAYAKLDRLVFCLEHVPDRDKHAFIEQEFGMT